MFSKKIHCPNCNYEGKAKKFMRGTLGMEILLWLLFLVPGIIYSLWRLTTRYNGCPDCSNENVISLKVWEKRKQG